MRGRIYWYEPDPNGGSVECSCDIQEAIAQQKDKAICEGFVYSSDMEALEDFIVNHWIFEDQEDEVD